jgi:hypothetical protein
MITCSLQNLNKISYQFFENLLSEMSLDLIGLHEIVKKRKKLRHFFFQAIKNFVRNYILMM